MTTEVEMTEVKVKAMGVGVETTEAGVEMTGVETMEAEVEMTGVETRGTGTTGAGTTMAGKMGAGTTMAAATLVEAQAGDQIQSGSSKLGRRKSVKAGDKFEEVNLHQRRHPPRL